jgi:hypothetical protein
MFQNKDTLQISKASRRMHNIQFSNNGAYLQEHTCAFWQYMMSPFNEKTKNSLTGSQKREREVNWQMSRVKEN